MKPYFLGLAALFVAANAHALSDGITAVNIDASMSQLTITGNGLKSSGNSIVTLGGVKLGLIAQNATTLVAICPGRAVGWAELAKPITRGRCASCVGTSYGLILSDALLKPIHQ
jgi:hypothetical protein